MKGSVPHGGAAFIAQRHGARAARPSWRSIIACPQRHGARAARASWRVRSGRIMAARIMVSLA